MKIAQLIKEQLRDRETFIKDRLLGKESRSNFIKLLTTSLIFLCAYGIIIGLNHSPLQALTTAIKLPALFFITTLICFPTLYFFLAVLQYEIDSWKLVSLLIASISIMSICFAVFSPIALFFLITTNGYFFFKLVNVLIFAIGGFMGMYTFYKNLLTHVTIIEGRTTRIKLTHILKGWVALYALIGSQLSYSLSPFFGDPNVEFMLFTDTQRGFFTDIIHSFMMLFS